MNSSFFLGALFVVILVLFYFAYRQKDKLKNFTSKVKVPTASQKLPLPKGRRKIAVLAGALILVLGVISYFWFSNKPVSKPTVMDDLPIWLLRDGKVAVYREMEIGKNSITTSIVVDNLGNTDQTDLKVYETIPKEFAQSASELEFSLEPEIIEDDPVVLWSVERRPVKSEPVGFTIKHEKDIFEMLDKCKQEGVGLEKFEKEQKAREEIAKEWGMDMKNVNIACLRHWQSKYQWAQKQTEEKYQAQREKIFKVLNVKDSEYKKIQNEAKKVINEEKKKATASTQTAGSVEQTIPLSESIFPKTLVDYSLKETNSPAVESSCYAKASPKKYVSAFYGKGDSAIAVAVTEYDNPRNAQATARICSSYMEENVIRPTMGGIATVEKKDDVAGHPFYITYAEKNGSKTIFAAFSSVGNYLIAMMKSEEGGGVESEYRGAIGTMIEILTGKAKPAESVLTPTPTNESAPTQSPASGLEEVSLASGWTNYVLSKSVTPCSNYSRNQSSSFYSVRCGTGGAAQWREYSAKEVSANGAGKMEIRANLGLKDYASFFGTGVKSDDYVDLIALSSDPRETLGAECNRTVSESDWSKCGFTNQGPSVLGHCGVPAYSESKSCDFEVTTTGLDNIYLVFRVADAWLSDVEGSLSNLQISYK